MSEAGPALDSEFLHFFGPVRTDLRAFIGSLIRNPHTREDVFQEVSRTLWEKFGNYDLSRPFGAWARGIAVRKILESKRRNERFPLLFPPETVEIIAGAFDETEEEPAGSRGAALKLCLESLPPRQRGLIAARYEQRRNCGEIARATGSTLKAVHQTLCRLRQALHRCITRRLETGNLSPDHRQPEPGAPQHPAAEASLPARVLPAVPFPETIPQVPS